jgi:hypothetical protein
MRVTQVQVEIEKRVGDNDYGSERAQVQLLAEVEDGEDADAVVAGLLDRVSDQVTERLRKSVTLVIRRKMKPKPRLCPECQNPLDDDEEYVHDACGVIREERAAREREERAARDRELQVQREANESNGWGWRTDAEVEAFKARGGKATQVVAEEPDDDDPGEDDDGPL